MKKYFKPLLFAVAFLMICTLSFAQGTGEQAGGFVLSAKVQWIIGIVLTVYELVVRYFPTLNNYSIIGNLYKLFRFLVPNKNAAGKDHE